jgi:hypothetical protein
MTDLFAGYLVGFLIWSGIALGCLGTALLQQVTGGFWGLAVRRIAEAGARTVLLVAVMFVPLLLELPALFPWARPEVVAASMTLQQKTPYLNVPFFIGRAVLYFACWVVLTGVLDRLSAREDREPAPAVTRRLQRLGIVGMIVLGLTVAFAMIDWAMSLEPDWYSTIYPSMVATGSLLGSFAFMILVFLRVAPRTDLLPLSAPRVRNDLGSMLLAFLMLWAYQAFSQYLLIWSGNVQEETPWYLRRSDGVWGWAAIAIMVLGFGVPFLLLIFRDVKRSVRWLGATAGLLFVMHVVEVAWLVGPGLGVGPLFLLSALASTIVLGAIWLWWFRRQLAARPLLALHDPRLANLGELAPEAEHAAA